MKTLSSTPPTLFLWLLLSALANAEEPKQPGIPQIADPTPRREAIHGELDANQTSVKNLYTLLDATPQSDAEARRYLESQIQRLDDRSDVLFAELDSVDRHQYERDRFHDVALQATRLSDEAQQLRRAGYLAPAIFREAKARALQRSLDDGTWKILVDNEWVCEGGPTDPKLDKTEVRNELQQLRSETASLREEVRQLRRVVEQLTSQLPDTNQHGK